MLSKPGRSGLFAECLDPYELCILTMTFFPRLVVSLASLVGAFSLACGSATGDPQASEVVAKGQSEEGDAARDAWVLPDQMGGIYQLQCAVCHGAELAGAAQGPTLLAEDFEHGDSVAEVTASISNGVPKEGMPAWADIIPADDIRGLAIYILEKREGDDSAARSGVGAPPVLPSGPISGELHSFTLQRVIGGLSEPYSIAPLPDGRILVTEKMRGISIIAADGSGSTRVRGTPRFYADAVLRGTTYAGTGWAHEVALHPNYQENGWIYLSYGDRCEQCNTVGSETDASVTMLKLVRGRLEGAEWTDQETIWEAPKETYVAGLENGAGARIAFDDAGYVYLSLGVFSGYRGVQNLELPIGKIHRMHDDGRTPANNPFVDRPGALRSIYTLGHRNPQGLDFDRRTRLMWSSEHGPRGGDEGNIIRSGRNYGWPLVSLGVDYDGRPITYAKKYGITFDPADLTPPTIDWTPSPGVSSIVFYRGQAFPKWQDHLLVATLGGNKLWRVVVDDAGARHTETLIEKLGRFRDIEIGPSGEVVILLEHRTGSQILRMLPASS